MALEDLASLRAVHGSTVLYPSDATSTTALLELMAANDGINYMRTTRGATPVIYDAAEEFQIGGSKTVLDGTDVTLIGAGITLHEARAAAERLAAEGISARVIDLYSVKPIDSDAIVKAAEETGAIVTVEDHWKEGGIGEAVLAALAEHGASAAVRLLAVEDMPSSATPAEMLRAAEIDAEAIYAAATAIVKTKVES
jgi:transketolase